MPAGSKNAPSAAKAGEHGDVDDVHPEGQREHRNGGHRQARTARRRSSKRACGPGSPPRHRRSTSPRAGERFRPSRRSTRRAADPLRCSTSHGNATIEMPLPAPAISAANRMTKSGPRLPLIMGYPGESNSGAARSATDFAPQAQWSGDAGPSPHRRRGSTRRCPAGSGWPGDPATPDTAVADTPAQVVAMADARGVGRPGRRRGVGVPRLPAAGRVARARRGREAKVVRRRAVLGQTGRRVGARRGRG